MINVNVNISLVIATANRPELIERTLRSLSNCLIPPNLNTIFIIENGNRNGIDIIIQKFNALLPIKYIYVPEGNKSLAYNKAIENIPDDDLIFFSDDDVRFKEDILYQYSWAANVIGKGHFFGGPFGVDYEKQPSKWLLEYLPFSVKGFSLEKTQPERFMGCNWAAFAHDVRSVGSFNAMVGPSKISAGAETDLQERLITHNIRPFYLKDAWVWHFVPEERCSSDWVLERAYRQARGSTRIWIQKKQSFYERTAKLLWWKLHPKTFYYSISAHIKPSVFLNFRREYWKRSRAGVLAELKNRKELDL